MNELTVQASRAPWPPAHNSPTGSKYFLVLVAPKTASELIEL